MAKISVSKGCDRAASEITTFNTWPLSRLATQPDSPPLTSGLRDLGSEVSLVAMAPLTAATALAALSGSIWTYQLTRNDFDKGIFLARVTAKTAEQVILLP